MRKPKRVTVLITIFLVSFCCTSIESHVQATTSEDDWPMFRHDPAHTGHSKSSEAPTNGTILWTAEKSPGGSPIVANGYVYFQDTLYLRCLNASDGQEVWKQEFYLTTTSDSSPAIYGDYVYTTERAYNALTGELFLDYSEYKGCGSPTVVNNMIYLGSKTRNSLFALDANTGTPIWNFTQIFYSHSSPAVVNGYVYFTSMDSNVYALDALTGTKIWNCTVNSYRAWSSPAVVNERLYVGTDDGVYCLDALNGAKLWNNSKTGRTDICSPAVANGVVYIGAGNSNIYALNASTGALLWGEPGGGASSPAVSGNIVYMGDTWDIIAFNASTGTQIWNYTFSEAKAYLPYTPAIVNGVLYASNYNKLYAFGTNTTTATPLPTGETFPTMWVIAAVVSVTVVAVGLVVYFKKRKS